MSSKLHWAKAWRIVLPIREAYDAAGDMASAQAARREESAHLLKPIVPEWFRPESGANRVSGIFKPRDDCMSPDGTMVGGPDVNLLTKEDIEYFDRRLCEVTSPYLISRYGMILLAVKKLSPRKPPDVVALVVRAECDLAERHAGRESHYLAACSFAQALKIVLMYSQWDLAKVVTERIYAWSQSLLNATERRDPPQAVCLLIEARKLQVEGIDLLARARECAETSIRLAEGSGDPHAFQMGYGAMVAVEQAAGDAAAVRRVRLQQARAMEEEVGRLAAAGDVSFLAAQFLEGAIAIYQDLGERERVVQLEGQLLDTYSGVEESMIRVAVDVPEMSEDVAKVREEFKALDCFEALSRLSDHIEWIPSRAFLRDIDASSTEAAPLLAMLARATYRGGEKVRSVTGDEIPEARLREVALLFHQMTGPIVARVLVDLSETGILTSEGAVEFVRERAPLAEGQVPLLQRGVEHFLDKDYSSSVAVLLPQVEGLCRLYLDKRGVAVRRFRRGAFQAETFGGLLHSEENRRSLGVDFCFLLETLLVEADGPNVRNLHCHGMLDADEYTGGMAAMVVHCVLLCIGLPWKETGQRPAENEGAEGDDGGGSEEASSEDA